MKTKCPIVLNIPKDKKLQFDDVSFVEKMEPYELRVFIKRLWDLLSTMANVFESRRRDVPEIIDRIRSGVRWAENDVQDRFQYGVSERFIIQYDTLENQFVLLDSEKYTPVTDPIKAMSISEVKKLIKRKKG